MKHQFLTPEECNCNSGHCNICDGGLALCKICGLLEGALTTDCPGEKCYEHADDVYAGKEDYINGQGWVRGAKNPTNQMWDRNRK